MGLGQVTPQSAHGSQPMRPVYQWPGERPQPGNPGRSDPGRVDLWPSRPHPRHFRAPSVKLGIRGSLSLVPLPLRPGIQGSRRPRRQRDLGARSVDRGGLSQIRAITDPVFDELGGLVRSSGVLGGSANLLGALACTFPIRGRKGMPCVL